MEQEDAIVWKSVNTANYEEYETVDYEWEKE